MIEVFDAEKRLLESMLMDERRLAELKDKNRRLEEQKSKLQETLQELKNNQERQAVAKRAAEEAALLRPPIQWTLTELSRCPKCVNQYIDDEAFCRRCSYPRKRVPTHCHYCGTKYLENENYCRVCGSHRHNTPTSTELGYSLPNMKESANSNEAFQFQKKIQIHTAQVHGVAMGKSSEVIATASWDQTVKIFNLKANEVVRTFNMIPHSNQNELRGLYSIAFAKTCDELIGCTSSDKSTYLWNHESGELKHRFVGHTDEVNDIDFHPTQQIMVTASDDCNAIVWDIQEGIKLRTLDKHFKAVYGCSYLGHQNPFLLATGSFDQHVRIFDMRDKSEAAVFKEHSDDIIGLGYCSHKQLLATGSDDGTICIWDARMWRLARKINSNEVGQRHSEVKRVAFSPNGSMLAAATSSGNVLVYDADCGKQLAMLEGHTECAFDVAWGVEPHSDAKILISASHDSTCRQWRVNL
jgi:WD40 repeat protein